MATTKLHENVYSIGVKDPNLRVFDIVMKTTHGTTYNSFLVKTNNNKTIIIDGVKDGFTEEWLDNIKEITPIDKIDVLIVNHTEPDHSGSIEELLKLNSNIEVYGSFLAMANLENIVNMQFKKNVVKDQDVVKFDDVTLRFLIVPNVHWPDTIITFYEERGIAFTCDFLGEHLCSDALLLSELKTKENYDYAFQYYYDSIMSPFKRETREALRKFTELNVRQAFPSHGPLIDQPSDVLKAVRKYSTWAITKRRIRPKITIVYVSSYGYTEKIVEAFKNYINRQNVDLFVYDMQISRLNDVLDDIENSDAFIVGSPTFVGDALKVIYDVLNSLNPFMVQGKYMTAFGSYGWSGEAVGNLLVRAKQLRMKVVDEGLKIRLKPNETELEKATEFIKEFVKVVKDNFYI